MIIEFLHPDHPDAVAILRAYLVELIERYENRPVGDAEVDQVLLDQPNDDLIPPRGLLLVARDDEGAGTGTGTVVGCVGIRWLDPTTTELTRMFVHPDGRRRGVASKLIGAAEDAARERGATRMRLDTRKDLVEARALYARHGYIEIDDYNNDFYADHWFEKPLG